MSGDGHDDGDASVSNDAPNVQAAVEPLLLDREQVAVILTVKPETVDWLRRERLLPAVKVTSKLVRWKPETVREFVKGLPVERAIRK